MDQSDNFLNNEMTAQALQALRDDDYDLAITITEEVLEREPGNAIANAVRFSSFFKSKQFERARQMGGRAAKLNPDSEYILNNQACLQLEAKQPAAASGLLKSLIDKYGENPQWLYNLALAQRMVGNYEYAIATFQRTLDLAPEHDKAAYQLADCLSVIGLPKDTARAYDYVRLLRNKHAPSHGNYIHYAAIGNALTATALQQEIRLWGDRFIPKDLHYPLHPIKNTAQLHIGFIVNLLPCRWFEQIVTPLVNQLATGADTISLFTHDERIDTEDVDERVKIIDSEKMSDSEFAKHARREGVDIIVDVCGMRKGCRQRALGLQVANRQFAWLAHEGVFATPLLKPLESLLGQKPCFVGIPVDAPHTGFPGKTLAGIGCKYGVSDAVLSSWAFVLHQLPEWKLHLDIIQDSARISLIQRFKVVGIEKERLLFDDSLAPNKGAIAMDNYTASDLVAVSAALRAGSSIVAMHGELFPAQQTASILKQVGLGGTISETPLDYAERVVALAQGLINPATASEERIEESCLNNVDEFAKRFREALTNQSLA